MIRAQSSHGRRFAQGTQSQINPFNPLQSYLIQNFNHRDYVNTISNKRISYFLDKKLNKEDEIYRQMLRNQISTGVMNDQKFASYMQKVTQAREQSEQDVKLMRIEQNKTEYMVKSAKNLKPKNAIKHVKITQEEFAINNCAQITDPDELKKQIKQLVHVNKIKNFVQRINNKKQIKYLNNALSEIKEFHKKRSKPIKYIVNENKDPRALIKPLRMPITDFKVVKVKQKPLNLSDDLTINFFDYHSKPHQIVVPKRTAEQQRIREDEIITSLGFKIRQTSEISVVAQSRNSSPEKQSPVRTVEDMMYASRRNRNMARERGLILDSEALEQVAREEIDREASEDMYQQKDDDNLFVTSFNPTYLKRNIVSAESGRTIQQSKFQQQYLNEANSPKESKRSLKFSNNNNQINGDNVIGSSKDINLGIQLIQTQSQVSNKMTDSKGQSNKMSQLLDQMNDYNNQNSTKHISSQINKFQNDYDKLQQQHFDVEQQQQTDLEQTLRNPERKSYMAKSQKAFLR